MKNFTTAELNKHIGVVTDAAMKAPVYITHHRRPRFVLMTVDDYRQLVSGVTDERTVFTLDDMPGEIEEGLLALADSFDRDDERR